jgi:hypothetical protein
MFWAKFSGLFDAVLNKQCPRKLLPAYVHLKISEKPNRVTSSASFRPMGNGLLWAVFYITAVAQNFRPLFSEV